MNLEKSNSKSIAKVLFTKLLLKTAFFILSHKNENDTVNILERAIDSSYIQFHFCTKGSSTFVFNKGTYTLNINEDTSLLLYNPQRDLPIHLKVQPHSWLVSLVISIEKFHGLFSDDANYVTFLTDDNRNIKIL